MPNFTPAIRGPYPRETILENNHDDVERIWKLMEKIGFLGFAGNSHLLRQNGGSCGHRLSTRSRDNRKVTM
jgi:hypothetical protein